MSKPLGTKQDTKSHRDKKNPRSAEVFAAARHAKNAERPKQVWIESHLFSPEDGDFVRDSHWSRG
jgi:hypothetical protein